MRGDQTRDQTEWPEEDLREDEDTRGERRARVCVQAGGHVTIPLEGARRSVLRGDKWKSWDEGTQA